MNHFFVLDERLGIHIPKLEKDWDQYTYEEQQDIVTTWERIRGRIPDRIAEIEDIINQKQHALGEENDFKRSCQLNTEISEHASIINDLWLWYRMNQSVSTKTHL